jgi:hypothetical protein
VLIVVGELPPLLGLVRPRQLSLGGRSTWMTGTRHASSKPLCRPTRDLGVVLGVVILLLHAGTPADERTALEFLPRAGVKHGRRSAGVVLLVASANLTASDGDGDFETPLCARCCCCCCCCGPHCKDEAASWLCTCAAYAGPETKAPVNTVILDRGKDDFEATLQCPCCCRCSEPHCVALSTVAFGWLAVSASENRGA